MTAITLFLCQLIYILLLGLQQLNVVGAHYRGAATVSLLLGAIGYQLTATIAIHADAVPFVSPVWYGYWLGGPVGICLAIWLHPRMRRWVDERKI